MLAVLLKICLAICLTICIFNILMAFSCVISESEHTEFMNRFFPNALVSPHHPDFFNLEIPLQVPRTTKSVAYWATDGPSRNATVLPTQMAYNRYDNSGVASVDNGLAIIRLASPQPYLFSDGQIVSPHFNYRLLDVNGTISPTYVQFLPSNEAHLKQRQLFHSSEYAYLPPVN